MNATAVVITENETVATVVILMTKPPIPSFAPSTEGAFFMARKGPPGVSDLEKERYGYII